MEINEVIYRNSVKKLRDKKRMDDYIDLCLEAEACPQCGKDLMSNKEGTSIPPVINYLCSVCGYSWKGVRPVGKLLINDPLMPNVARELEKKEKKQKAIIN